MNTIKKENIFRDGLRSGLILGLILIIFSVIVYIFDLPTMGMWSGLVISLINIVILFISIVVMTKAYRDTVLNGGIKYGKALLFGIVISFYSAIILAVYNYIFNTLIDPDYTKRVMEIMSERTADYMYQQGMPDEKVEEIMNQMRNKEVPSAAVTSVYSILSNTVMGLVISLITSAFVRRKKPEEKIIEELKNKSDNK